MAVTYPCTTATTFASMRNLIFFSFLLLFSGSCKKEDDDMYDETLKYVKENMVFSCTEPKGISYFSGKMNGVDFCVSDGVDGYWSYIGTATETITLASNPTIELGVTKSHASFYSFYLYPPILDNWHGIFEEFKPYVFLYTPYIFDTITYSQKHYLDKFLKKGDLKLRKSWAEGKEDGFYLLIGWGCVMLPGYDFYKNQSVCPYIAANLSPSNGKQENTVFRISELEVEEQGEYIMYEVTFEISCDLYYDGAHGNDYFGRLEDGIYKLNFSIPSEE